MSNSLEDNLLDAIDILVTDAVEKAEFDRTIQATVVSCIDASIGKYKCKYMDSTFYAYSDNVDNTYPDNSTVYITVPNGDMTAEKLIVGTVKKLGTNYVSEIEPEDYYDKVGTNIITTTSEFGLCSYNDKTLVLYEEGKKSLISIDVKSAEEYIKNSSSLILGATVRTELPIIQQFKGNYGITFTLAFFNNLDGSTYLKDYTLDVDSMTGNPYKYINTTRVYTIYDIDAINFKSITKISIFNKDFPEQDTTKTTNDIFIGNIELMGAENLDSSSLTGTYITFITPNGTFFDESNSLKEKTIQAQVKVKGNIVNPEVQDIKFYWYKEDVSITPSSVYYNKQGGRGWKCLNEYNILQLDDSGDETVVEWVPALDTLTLTIDQAVAKENKIKCVINYSGSYISKTITIKNLSASAPVITIESDLGTQFYYDRGAPTLTCSCSINGAIVDPKGYEYVWVIEDENGAITSLPETPEIQKEIQEIEESLAEIEAAIAAGTKFEKANTEIIAEKNNRLEELKAKQNVYKNQITSVDISQINGYATYKCSVIKIDGDESTYQGTGSITLLNSYEGESSYRLVINNGHQIFKYNEDGISPCSASLDLPMTLNALTFTLYDEKGNAFEEKDLQSCDIEWKVPITRTLLSVTDTDGTTGGTDETQTYQYYRNTNNLIYSIANKFDYTKDLNNIELTLNFKGTLFTASTNFIFLKEGDSGTNGTSYSCKIVPYVYDSTVSTPSVPTISIKTGQKTGTLNYSANKQNKTFSTTISASDSLKLFQVELWANGERIYKSNESGTIDTKPITVSWSILKNKYSSTISDKSYLELKDATTGSFALSEDLSEEMPANLVKCTVIYNGMTLTDVMPVMFITNVINDSSYSIKLTENSGFKSVLYSSDGLNPQYSTSPFEIKVYKKISSEETSKTYQEDISTIKGEYAVQYDWEILGNIYEKKDTGSSYQIKNTPLLDIVTSPSYLISDLKDNQKRIKPVEIYDGQCVNTSIKVTITRKDSGGTAFTIGIVRIPVHLMFNTYGMSALNNWDGDSIQIDEEGGFILSPQIGAGKKDEKNKFTGVLMGEVKEANRSTSDIGLIGYSEGQKSFFIDSQTGAVQLGKQGSGRIMMDPTNGKALLYSEDYWANYDKETGFPVNYNESNFNEAGMIIDLTTPEIKFGSGNFSVDSEGNIISKSGTIGAFHITETSLYSANKQKWGSTKEPGVYIGPEGICLGDHFWVYGKDDTDSYGSHKAGDIYASGGTIGNFTLTDTCLYSGEKSSWSSYDDGIYIGKEGLCLGGNFWVYAKEGKMTARGGTIANWTITNNELYSGSHKSLTSIYQGAYIGKDGISLGGTLAYKDENKTEIDESKSYPSFMVTSNGVLTAKSGTIGGWEIGSNSLSCGNVQLLANGGSGSIQVGSTFTVNNKGQITATSGTVGGWTLGSYYIGAKINKTESNGTTHESWPLVLYSDGSINKSSDANYNKWHIDIDGNATFNNITCTGEINATSGTIQNLTSASLPLGSTFGTYNAGTQFAQVDANTASIKNLVADVASINTLTINKDGFSVGGKSVYTSTASGLVTGVGGTWKYLKIVDHKPILYASKPSGTSVMVMVGVKASSTTSLNYLSWNKW
jgi:hypothetical protein